MLTGCHWMSRSGCWTRRRRRRSRTPPWPSPATTTWPSCYRTWRTLSGWPKHPPHLSQVGFNNCASEFWIWLIPVFLILGGYASIINRCDGSGRVGIILPDPYQFTRIESQIILFSKNIQYTVPKILKTVAPLMLTRKVKQCRLALL